MKPLWLPVLVLLIALSACSSLTTRPEPPRVTLAGLKPVSMELFEQRYSLRLRIKNPNAFVLPVRGVDFRLAINDEDFADGVSSQVLDVPAYGESLLEMEISSNLLQVFRQLQSLHNKQPAGIKYRIRGNIAMGDSGRRLPFDNSGEFLSPAAHPSER